MPQLHSGVKRLRSNKKKRLRNQQVQSELKTLTKKLRSTVVSGDKQAASSQFTELMSKLQKAKSAGIVHRRTASRYVSRAARQVQRITDSSSKTS